MKKVLSIIAGSILALFAVLTLFGGPAEPGPQVPSGVETAGDVAWGLDTLLLGAASAGFFTLAFKRDKSE